MWRRFGSVRLRFVHGTVRAVPVFGSDGSLLERVFFCFSMLTRKGRVRFRFLKNGSDGSGSSSGFWKTVPTVPVSGSGSVAGPSWMYADVEVMLTYSDVEATLHAKL